MQCSVLYRKMRRSGCRRRFKLLFRLKPPPFERRPPRSKFRSMSGGDSRRSREAMVVIHTAGIHMKSIHMGAILMGAMITITATVTGVQVKDRGWGTAAGCCSLLDCCHRLFAQIKTHLNLLQDSYGLSVLVRLFDRLQSASNARGTKCLQTYTYIVVCVTGLLIPNQ
jgi:hypothetical protein